MGRRGHAWFRSSRNCYSTKIGGKMYDLPVGGPESEERRREADAARVRLLADLNAVVAKLASPEVVPPAAAQSKTRPGTVAELVPRYLLAADIEPQTRTDYGDRLAWLVRAFGGLAVGELDAEEVGDAARSAGWASNTRRQTLAVAQGFVRWCRRGEFKLKLPPVESRGDDAVLTPEEYKRLVAAAAGDFRHLLVFMRQTGCRQGEACKLTAELATAADGVVVLKDHKTKKKTGRRRNVYLNATAAAVLAGQAAKYGTGPLFRGGRGKGITSRRAGVLFRRAADAAGLGAEKTLNSLRHTFATAALEAEVSDSDVATLLGHSGTAMIHRHYAHLTANARRLKDVASRLDAAG